MRIRTLVLIPLVALLGVFAIKANATSLPASQSQISANAPQQEASVIPTFKLDEYLSERQSVSVSRSRIRAAYNAKIIKTGKQYIGTPYCHGGTTPRCFDCSGFTQYLFRKQGDILPRSANSQLRKLKIIPKSQAVKGDLIFFVTKNGYAYHVGIYLGGNKVLHSPKPGRRVKVETIWTTRVKYARLS